MAESNGLLRRTWNSFSEDECMMRAASLSYYAVFSLPAILVLVSTITGFAMGQRMVTGEFQRQLSEVAGPAAAEQVAAMAQNASEAVTGSVWATIIGFAVLIVSATGVLVSLQSTLDRVWDVEPDPRVSTVGTLLMQRIWALLLIIGIALVGIAALVASSAMMSGSEFVTNLLPSGLSAAAAQAIGLAINVGILTVMFAILFKVLPDARIRWGVVWGGALATALLFAAGQWLMSLYFGRSDFGSGYGAAGSLVLLMVWIYYSSIVLLLGAELTREWARGRGDRVRAAPGAVRVIWQRQELRGQE